MFKIKSIWMWNPPVATKYFINLCTIHLTLHNGELEQKYHIYTFTKHI